MGEPTLSRRELDFVARERRRGARERQMKRREAERNSLHTCFKGPAEHGSR